MSVTKDELITAFLYNGRASFELEGVLFYNVHIHRVALRRMSDGEIKVQADMWNERVYTGYCYDESWKTPIRTVSLEDIVAVDPPNALRTAVAMSFDRGKHWLTEAMELQTPVAVSNYHLQGGGWLVCGVTIERIGGRYVVGAELMHPSCPGCIVAANPRHLSLECAAQADAS